MGNYRKGAAAGLIACALLAGCGGYKDEAVVLDPENPRIVTVWHYYNGAQMEMFNELAAEFNETEGKEQGIFVEGVSQGSVADLEKNVLDAVQHKVGADEVPSIFAAYADTAYTVDRLGYAVDLSGYLTQEEQDAFVDSYLEEGRFSDDSGIRIFPVAKSTEVMVLNKTDWEKFAEATGAEAEDLATIEGVAETAERYYKWTDSLTQKPGDGKAFFGRDAMANYMLIGARQLGSEIFSVSDGRVTVNCDRDVFYKLWENYYVPYVKGYFYASSRFRSDDIKMGNILAFVGAASGAAFFPDEVILNDTDSYPIELQVLEAPQFEGGERWAVQQGAGMVVTKTEEEEIYASVQFLKWFAREENNIRFCMASGYLPVTESANRPETISRYSSLTEERTLQVLDTAIETVNTNALYTTKAFENGTEARSILEHWLSKRASADRSAVEQAMQQGAALEDAAAAFVSEDAFESWYQEIKEELERAVNRERQDET